MALLTLERVSKTYVRGRRELVALHDVSLELEAGEIVGVWGRRFSGRTTLLRVAAGLERPDAGRVRFAGRALPGGDDALDKRIGFVETELATTGGQRILDYVAMPLLARGVAPARASARAAAELERAGACGCAELHARDLDAAELLRVAIAQALVTAPELMLVDDPTRNVDLMEREGLLALLRAIADGGTAILMTTGEAMGVAGVDRALTISEGVLRAEVAQPLAPVVPLARSAPGGPA